MPTKVKGCRNCSRRRINCDGNKPHCRKCIRDNLECYGLSGTYRWMAASTARKKRERIPASANLPHLPQIESSDVEVETQMTLPSSSIAMLPSKHPDLWVMNYFAEQITPWMCPILRADNECKTHVLPLAMSSPLVFDAVAATTYHRLAYYGNCDFAERAERYKASAIKVLLQSCRSVCSPCGASNDRLFSAAALLILMYDEMVAAHDYFTTLVRIMVSMCDFVDFSFLGGSFELRRYLQDQFRILTMFSLPHLDTDASVELQPRALKFVQDFELTTKTDRHSSPFLAYCWRTMLTIWDSQRQKLSLDVTSVLEEFRSRIEALDDIMEFDHYLTWVYFMASAASLTPSLRKFFMERLFKHTTTFGWKNVAMMYKFLGELEGAGSAWPSRLQSHKQYICA